jgi:hypothetical protein
MPIDLGNLDVVSSGAVTLTATGANAANIRTNGADRVHVTSAGNVGIGTSTPGEKLDVPNGNIQCGNDIAAGRYNIGSNGAYLTRYSSDGSIGLITPQGSVLFGTNATERMRIHSTGHISIDNSTLYSDGNLGTAILQVRTVVGTRSAIAVIANTTGSVNGMGFVNPNGTIGTINMSGSTTTYVTSSDYRLKDITGAVTGSEAKNFIMALQPKQGTWKADGSKFVGFLAHEFQEVSPSSVSGEKDAVDEDGKPIYQAMQAATSEVMANLIAFIQEQQAQIEQLHARVAELEAK